MAGVYAGNDTVRSVKSTVVELIGKFTLGATSAVASQDMPGVTVANTAAGKWTLTTDVPYAEMLGLQAMLFQQGTGVDLFVQLDAEYSGSVCTIVTIQTADGADTAPTSGDVIYLRMTMQQLSAGL